MPYELAPIWQPDGSGGLITACPGADKPALCPAGYYCPTPAGQVRCPSGHFCRDGQSKPFACAPLTRCDPGTSAPVSVSAFVIVIGLVTVILVLRFFVSRHLENARRDRRARNALVLQLMRAEAPELVLARARRVRTAEEARLFVANLTHQLAESTPATKPLHEGIVVGNPLAAPGAAPSADTSHGPVVSTKSRRFRQSIVGGNTELAARMELQGAKAGISGAATDRINALTADSATLLKRQATRDPRSLELPPELQALLPGGSSETYNQLQFFKPKEYRMNLRMAGLGLKLRNGSSKTVLRNVSGSIAAGNVCAIMGPSGAGKSSLLSALLGKAHYGVTFGDVLVNGQPAELQDFRPDLGYVPQDDILHSELTVRQNLKFAARSRLPRGTTRERVNNVVADVLRVLDLEAIQDEVVGDAEARGISGGQRKRVNIGMEMVADPLMLTLDEPTSGLDSTASYQVVKLLRQIATLGVNVLCVLHQPRYEVFQLFTRVLLLGKGGVTVYLGPAERCAEYFEAIGYVLPVNTNPADFFMDAIAGDVQPRVHPLPDHSLPLDAADLPQVWARRRELLDKELFDALELDDPLLLAVEDVELMASRSQSEVGAKPVPIARLSSMPEEADGSDEDKGASTPGSEESPKFDKQLESARSVSAAIPPRKRLSLNPLRAKVSIGVSRRFMLTSSSRQISLLGSTPTTQDIDEAATLFPPYEPRVRPGFFTQVSIFAEQGSLQILAKPVSLAVSLLLEALAGVMLGAVFTEYNLEDWPSVCLLTVMSLGMTVTVNSLKTYGAERLMYWREASSGIHRGAYFIGKQLASLPLVAIMPAVFSTFSYALTWPRTSLHNRYALVLGVSWSASGVGQLLSCLLSPSVSQLAGVVITLIFCLFGGVNPTLSQLESGWLTSVAAAISYPRYAIEALWAEEVNRWDPVWKPSIELAQHTLGFDLNGLVLDHLMLWVIGVAMRVLALLALMFTHRAQQA